MSHPTTKPNLFTSAKKVDTTKKSKSKTLALPVPPELEPHLIQFKEAKAQCKKWEGKKKIEDGIIKIEAAEIFLAEYRKQGRNIGSFNLGDVGVCFKDQYATMDEEVGAIVAEKFPNVVEKKTEYLLNQEMLMKHIEPIAEALQNAKGIPEEDLAELIQKKEVYVVKSGTIDTLATYGDQMEDLFHAISPIIALR